MSKEEESRDKNSTAEERERLKFGPQPNPTTYLHVYSLTLFYPKHF